MGDNDEVPMAGVTGKGHTKNLKDLFEKKAADSAKVVTSRTKALEGLYAGAMVSGNAAKFRPLSALPPGFDPADFNIPEDGEAFEDGYGEPQDYEDEGGDDDEGVPGTRQRPMSMLSNADYDDDDEGRPKSMMSSGGGRPMSMLSNADYDDDDENRPKSMMSSGGGRPMSMLSNAEYDDGGDNRKSMMSSGAGSKKGKRGGSKKKARPMSMLSNAEYEDGPERPKSMLSSGTGSRPKSVVSAKSNQSYKSGGTNRASVYSNGAAEDEWGDEDYDE